MNYIAIFLSMIPMMIVGIIAIGRLSAKVQANCNALGKKVDKDVCDMQHKYISSKLKEIQDQLDRIEGKI